MFENLGPGFSLLAIGASAESVEVFRFAAASLGLPLAVIDCGEGGEPGRYEAQLVLVRPDQFVAWTSNAGSEISTDQARKILTLASGNHAVVR